VPAKQARESIEAELELPISSRLWSGWQPNQDAIDHAQIWLNALSKIVSGHGDELPDQLKRELAEETDAELMGAKLLARIVQNHR